MNRIRHRTSVLFSFIRVVTRAIVVISTRTGLASKLGLSIIVCPAMIPLNRDLAHLTVVQFLLALAQLGIHNLTLPRTFMNTPTPPKLLESLRPH